MILLDLLSNLFRIILSMFTGTRNEQLSSKKLQIFVKCGSESIVPVFLEEDWTVRDLKSAVAAKQSLNAEEMRIIFAGRELQDNIKLQDCDVGEQSVIHAVLQKKKLETKHSTETKGPLNQTPFCSGDFEKQDAKNYSKKSHFFVFCSSPCNSLCSGKLRVKCSSCKEGTLTVDQDPTCWEDVLSSRRIKGRCLGEKCSGTYAEFYFKCSSHISTSGETAVPLYLVKNNYKEVPCIACTGVSQLVLVFPCSDGHSICLECFNLYCFSRLNERRFIQDEKVGYTIDCPAGCSDSLIQEPHHFKLLGEEQYSRYQRFGAEEYLLQAGGVLCPQPGCGAGLLPSPGCVRIVCAQEGGVGCGFVFCKQCMQGYHIGPCDPTEENGVENGVNYAISDERASSSKWEDEVIKKVIKMTTKPCPKCRTPTEKDGGCMHMVCTRSQCGFHWCWVCQEEWTHDCMANHWFG